MKERHTKSLSIIRFVTALLVAPFITVLLIVAPKYPHEWFFMLLWIVCMYTYTIALFIGLPVALVLYNKHKCTFRALAVSGFVISVSIVVAISVHMTLDSSYESEGVTLESFVDYLIDLIWYGVSAAIGASIFGLISGITSSSIGRKKHAA